MTNCNITRVFSIAAAGGTPFKLLPTALVCAALAACGGGDGDVAATAMADAASARMQAQAIAPAAAAPYTLAVSVQSVLVRQGGSATVKVTVTRSAGFTGDVQLTLVNLPAGLWSSAVTVPAGATSATVKISASATARHRLPTVVTVSGSHVDQLATVPLTVTVGGAPGKRDTSFASTAAATPVGAAEDYVGGMAVQADGKVIVVGNTTTPGGGTDFAIVRYLRDGKLDTNFNGTGKVITSIAPGQGSDQATSVVVQPDGKILVAGYVDQGSASTSYDFALVRYLKNGSLDTTFGNGGKVIASFGTGVDKAHAIAIQPDGKIVVAGESYQSASTGIDFAVARFLPNGTPDAGFGALGKVTTAIGSHGTRDSGYAVALQQIGPEVRIVVAGGEGDFVAARYTSAGVLDPEFGNGGRVSRLFESVIGAARGIAVTPDNKIVLAGGIQNDVALVRLDINGRLDSTFAQNGRTITPLSTTNWDQATAIVRQVDGKLVVGGWVYAGNSSSADFAALRFTADGALDSTFGTGGKVITPVSALTKDDAGRALALQADSRVPTVRAVQAGESSDSNHDFAVIRYWL